MYTKQTLDNGLRVLLSPMHETKSVTVLILFGVGSRYEHKKISGVSHFLEHLMFKGTKKRPTTLDISKELDAVGAEYNAFTSKDYTGYYIKIAEEHLDLALDMLSDMLFNSVYDAKEIEREKKVICEEIKMYKDNPLMYIDTLLEQVMFPNSSLGWDIAGDCDTVLAIERDEILKYKEDFYQASNTVLGVAGKFDDSIMQKIQKYFDGGWKTNKKTDSYKPFTNTSNKKPEIEVQHKETEQAQLAFGYRGYDYLHKDIYAATLLAIILGGSMSSRLFIQVRERLGLAYSIRASHQSYQDIGVFSVQAGLDKSRLEEAVKVIRKELNKVTDDGVSEAELSRAKEFIKGQLALKLEGSDRIASWFVNQELLTDQTLTPEQKVEKIFDVSKEDVQRVAKDLLKDTNMSIAVIGPYKNKEEIEKML